MGTDVLRTLEWEAPQRFRSSHTVYLELESAADAHPELVELHELGTSEGGRSIHGVLLGTGPVIVSLIAGAHADEPVGPETLRTLILSVLAQPEKSEELLRRVRFVIVPHVNPDGEARNRRWMRRWPGVRPYIEHRVREEPGRDLEFGFPSMRVENEAVSAFLRDQAPYDLHVSLHGTGFSDGALLLIERHWSFRTDVLQADFAKAVQEAGLRLHDRNRKGEKGFFYLGPGFWTTPEGEAMCAFFRAQGDWSMTSCFHDTSMEFVRSLGSDPLCLVTELPLFLLGKARPHPPSHPIDYLTFQDRLAEVQARIQQLGGDPGGSHLAKLTTDFGLEPLPLDKAIRLQLEIIQLGLEAVME